MVDKYLNIINHFGINNQCNKLQEEMNETLEAINELEEVFNREARHEDEDFFEEIAKKRNHVIEEIGDVLTILTQFIFFYQIEKKELDSVMDFKLNRTLDRIKTGYYEKK